MRPFDSVPWTMCLLDDVCRPLDDEFIGSCVPEWWVSTLDRMQAVDNHEATQRNLSLVSPAVLGNPSFAHLSRHIDRVKYADEI